MLCPPVLAKLLSHGVGNNEVLLERYPPSATPYAIFAIPDHRTKGHGGDARFFLDLAKGRIGDSLTYLNPATGSRPARAIYP